MNDARQRDSVLALAGLFQAATLVRRVARGGMVDSGPFAASIGSLFAIDADSTGEVFGGAGNLRLGLEALRLALDPGDKARDMDATRYVVSLMHLERKLHRNRRMLEQIRAGIQAATAQAEHFPVTHENVVAHLADLYHTTISTLSPRILVQGEALHLQNPDNANRIRALLLAGIRAAVLWRQLGGSRIKLLLGRRRTLETIAVLLTSGD